MIILITDINWWAAS